MTGTVSVIIALMRSLSRKPVRDNAGGLRRCRQPGKGQSRSLGDLQRWLAATSRKQDRGAPGTGEICVLAGHTVGHT